MNKRQAERILTRMRGYLYEKFVGIGEVIYQLKLVPVKENILFETDGIHIFYSPKNIIQKAHGKMMRELIYAYMHIIAHGLLNHFSIARDYERNPIMHILMDMEVYIFLKKLGLNPVDEYRCFGEGMDSTKDLYTLEDKQLSGMYILTKKSKVRKQSIFINRKKYQIDNHQVWYRNRKYRGALDVGKNTRNTEKLWQDFQKQLFGSQNKNLSAMAHFLMKKMNKNSYGMNPGNMSEYVTISDRKGLNYKSVLKKFFHTKEKDMENMESIDKALYAWGFSNYSNIAFVEPEDEAVCQTMNTVILAIDTSGSCCGETMKRFMTETKELFMEISKISFKQFLILQCDTKIQKVDSYKSVTEFPNADYLAEQIPVFGYGGTDFIPVFQYIENLVKEGEQIDCLIYLTDGYGRFPNEEQQGYKSFFVMEQDDEDPLNTRGNCQIPEWIECLYLKNEKDGSDNIW